MVLVLTFSDVPLSGYKEEQLPWEAPKPLKSLFHSQWCLCSSNRETNNQDVFTMKIIHSTVKKHPWKPVGNEYMMQ